MSRYFKPTLLKPRSVREQEERSPRRDRRQSIIMRSNPGLLMTAIPAILTAAAVYVSLVYASKLTTNFFSEDEPQQLVRPVDGVTKVKPFVERTPPPSPEAVAAAFLDKSGDPVGPDGRRPIVLEPELEPASPAAEEELLTLQPVDLGPFPNSVSIQDVAAEAAPSLAE